MNTAAREIVTSDGVVLRVMVIDDGEYLKRSGATIVSDAGGGGGGGAPTGATYVTLTTNGSLTNERVLTAGSGVSITDAGAGSTVTVALADIATDRLLGRDTAGTGAPEALTVGGGVEFSGAGGIQRSALTGDVTAAAGSGSVTVDQARGLRETSGPTTLAMGSVADGEVLYRSGSTVDGRPTSSVNIYTTAGPYSLAIPSWATFVTMQVQAGGGGGASGGRQNVGTSADGGGGGASGAYAERILPTSLLTTDLAIVVGAGGTGATALVANGTPSGTGGTDGGESTIADGGGQILLRALGGGKAIARTGAGATQLNPEMWKRTPGGNGGSGAGNGQAPTADNTTIAPAGGGGGGGISAGNADSDGGTGGWGGLGLTYDSGGTNGGAGGTTAGASGNTPTAPIGYGRGAGGGGGGAGGAGDGSGNGGTGGAGIRGSGGGGGGAGHAPGSSGTGGAGGAGYVVVTFT